jgi:thymidylate synthase (FAD)
MLMKVTLMNYMGSDLDSVNAARVSFNKKSRWEVGDNDSYDLSEKDQKLITYLGKEGHYAPFGHNFASFHVKAPIFVCRQLVKHEYLRMSEVSRRYVTDMPEFYIPDKWRGAPVDKKQGSSGVVDISYTKLQFANMNATATYKDLLDNGVAPEMARMVLPLNTYTEWYWSGSLDAFANIYNLRTGEGAQEESKTIATMIGNELKEVFPYSWKALTNG